MSEAIWYVTEDMIYVVLGAIAALYVPVALLFILFYGNRAERGRAWGARGVFTRRLFTSSEESL